MEKWSGQLWEKIPCDLTVCNIQLVNMFSGEVYPAQVDILDGIIVRVRTDNECPALPSERIFDGGGRYLIPGFIDSHLHVESTMMVPENFGRAVLPWGPLPLSWILMRLQMCWGLKG